MKSWLIALMLLQVADAMLYRESLNMEELMKLFDEDECIDGTISAMETEEPVFQLVSSIDSLLSVNRKVSNSPTESKSPLSSISELAVFNNLMYQYNLIEEHGPSHNKRFVVNLTIGEEQYQAEGRSIKKAQQEAARLALNSTLYQLPPQKPVADKPLELRKTSVQKLSDWVAKYSDAKVAYYYSQHSKSVPTYHENFYHLEAENIHRVTVHINDEQFIGEGLSAVTAKENAAKEALANLREIQGMCMFTDDERSLLSKVFLGSDDQSPISLVNEFASKTQAKSSFDLVAEEGPAHIKNFIFKCTVGSLESYGEGSSKKSAKSEAAEKMIELLKIQASKNSGSCDNIVEKKRKSRKPKNIVKSEVKTFSEDDDNYDFHVSEKLDPVSKLFQIQQKTRGIEPVFRSLSEKGENNQFLVEVIVGDLSFVGSGLNKKAAKKSAAEGILTKMGYSTDSIKTGKPNSWKEKRTSFHKFKKAKSTPIGAGLHFNSKKVMESLKNEDNEARNSEATNLPKSKIKSKNPTGFDNKETNLNKKPSSITKSENKPSSLQAKVQLEKISRQLGFRFQFSDFPKGNDTGFLSLLSLTTDPAKVCYGVGDTVESSQQRAALTALENIYKTELTSISQILKDHRDEKFKQEETIIRIMPAVQVETE